MIDSITSFLYSNTIISSDLMKFVSIYMFWSAVHIVSSKLYSTYCANWSWRGFLLGGLQAITPHCKSLLWLQNTTTNGFNSWWLTTSSWFVIKISKFSNVYKYKNV